MPGRYSNRISITAYIDESIFNQIEENRGRISRSEFVGNVLSEIFGGAR